MSDEERINVGVADAIGWDDRKHLLDLWQNYSPLPEAGLRESVYPALLAVASYGAEQALLNEIDRDKALRDLVTQWQGKANGPTLDGIWGHNEVYDDVAKQLSEVLDGER